MGVIGYQRPFIPNFSAIAKPILKLTKKNQPFEWMQECTKALDTLINMITSDPILRPPDLDRQFHLDIDASNYAIGGILYQLDDDGIWYDVGYYSKSLVAAERNYDIWDCEYLALIRCLLHWRQFLVGSPHKVQVYTDHTNLQYWREPRKIPDKIRRYITTLSEYDVELFHQPGKKNWADVLSRRPDFEREAKTMKKEEVIALPDHLFLRRISTAAAEEGVQLHQTDEQYKEKLQAWIKEHKLHKRQGQWWKGEALAVVGSEDTRRMLVEIYHDSPTAGHPGMAKTLKALSKFYWWPDVREFVQEYVRGCTTCQANKIITQRNNPPLNPIPPESGARPFQTIAMDLIVKLPKSQGNDSILTITDHDCTKAVILIPCNEEMNLEQLAELYKDKAFPYTGIPSKIISDRDVQLTSHFSKELCKQLDIQQNISTAYHPQTDGQSEKTNQHVKTALRIFMNYQQDNWTRWLPIVQYLINAQKIEEQKEQLEKIRSQAQEAMKRVQSMWRKEKEWTEYQVDQKVWLEAKNIKTTQSTTKLRALQYGPFKIINKLGPVTYQLMLLKGWKIYNVFHASLLLPYKETKEHGRNFKELPPELIEGEEEYKVEEIRDKRKRQNKTEYLIKWKGYYEAEKT